LAILMFFCNNESERTIASATSPDEEVTEIVKAALANRTGEEVNDFLDSIVETCSKNKQMAKALNRADHTKVQKCATKVKELYEILIRHQGLSSTAPAIPTHKGSPKTIKTSANPTSPPKPLSPTSRSPTQCKYVCPPVNDAAKCFNGTSIPVNATAATSSSPAGSPGLSQFLGEARKKWAELDVDQSGYLEGDAEQQALAKWMSDALYSGSAKKMTDMQLAREVSKLLRHCDTNDDGKVSWDEFQVFFKSRIEGQQQGDTTSNPATPSSRSHGEKSPSMFELLQDPAEVRAEMMRKAERERLAAAQASPSSRSHGEKSPSMFELLQDPPVRATDPDEEL